MNQRNFYQSILFSIGLTTLSILLPSFSGQGQTPIAFGECLNGTLPLASSITYETPTFQSGDVILIRVKAFGLNLKVELVSPEGMINLFIVPYSTFFDTIYTIPTGELGSYNIIVSNNGNFTGNFSIALEQMNEPASAVFLECDETLSGNSTCRTIVKTFKFLVQEGSRSRITIDPGGWSPEAWVCDRYGNILRHKAQLGGVTITIDTILAPETACLYVFVASADGYFNGDYSIGHTTIFGSCASVSLLSTPNAGTICEGESFTLNASSPIPNATYSWTGPNGFTSDQQEIIIDEANSTQSGTYSVSANSLTVCSSTASKSILVHALPTATASVLPADTLCAGLNFTLNVLTDAASPTYAWSGPNGYSSSLKSPTITTSDTSQTELRVYTVTVTDGTTGCTRASSISVQVNARPTATITSPVSAEVCEGTTLSLNVATNAPNVSFSWSGPASFSSLIQNPTISNVMSSNQGTYSVTVTNTDTGCSKTASKFISVNPTPSANISGNLSICAGESTVLTASGGGAYVWSNGNTSSSITVSPVQTTTYSITVTNPTTGCTNSTSKTVEVKPLPSISIMSTPTEPVICSGTGNILLCASSDAEIPVYHWTSTGFSATNQCVTFEMPSETGTYLVSVTDEASGCANVGSLPVVIHTTPTVNIFQTPEQPFCNGTDFTLCATSNASNPNYQWTGPGNFIGSSLCVSINEAGLAQSGIYAVSVTSNNGCLGTSNSTIQIGTPLQCEGQFNNGTVTALATGSFPPYTYTLFPGGQSNSTGVFYNLNSSINYSINVTDYSDCMCSTAVITGTVDPVKQWGISISPNPGPGVFEIAVETIPVEEFRFVLFDITGHQLRSFIMEMPTKTLDLTDLSSGVYLLRVSDGRNTGTLRLVSIP